MRKLKKSYARSTFVLKLISQYSQVTRRSIRTIDTKL